MRRVWLLAATTIACAAPGEPTFPDRTVIGPPPAVGDACELPFPVNFAQDWFVLADLDRGVSCDVFLEQDECAVGIYHDCTDDSANPREWQGVVDSDPNVPTMYVPIISLTAKYDAETTGTRLPRGPTCCRGGLFPRSGDKSPDFTLLECHETQCASAFDRFHTGLFLERRRDVNPKLLHNKDIAFDPGAETKDAVFVGGRLWAIVGNAIYTYDPMRSDSMRLPIDVSGANVMTPSLDRSAIYVGSSSLIRIDVGTASELNRVPLGGSALAIAATVEGVIVAFDDGNRSSLRRFDSDLTPQGGARPQTVRINGLAGIDQASRPALATAEAMSEVWAVTSTLAMEPILDLALTAGFELGDIAPVAPFFVDGAKVGMIADCYQGAPTRHCYFEIDTAEPSVSRVGVPDVIHIERAAYDVSSNRIVLSTAGGKVAFIDRSDGFRPRVQELVSVGPVPLGAVAIDADRQIAYVVHSGGGAASVVEEPK